MSMPAELDRYYTREEVLALPDDGNRYELVHGELLVSPSPRYRHQSAVLRLATILDQYARTHKVGTPMISPADLAFGRDDLMVQPDLFVIAAPPGATREWHDVRALLLVVEVLSPSTSRYDRFTKRRLYQELGVPLYWIIDPEEHRAEVWTPEASAPLFEAGRLTWHPDGAGAPLVIDLAEVLAV